MHGSQTRVVADGYLCLLLWGDLHEIEHYLKSCMRYSRRRIRSKKWSLYRMPPYMKHKPVRVGLSCDQNVNCWPCSLSWWWSRGHNISFQLQCSAAVNHTIHKNKHLRAFIQSVPQLFLKAAMAHCNMFLFINKRCRFLYFDIGHSLSLH